MNIKIEEVKEVIQSLKAENLKKFSSHKFIGSYIKMFEGHYIEMLVEYKNNNTQDIFKVLHSQIAIFLESNQDRLNISFSGNVEDMNVHHIKTANAEWKIL